MNIILFDGVCDLCNSTVQFIIERDKLGIYKFSSLQSEFGQAFLKKKGYNTENFSTIILIDGEDHHTMSTAILHIMKNLSGYRWFGVFLIVPKLIRDYIYSIISNNRHSFFKKSKTSQKCLLPDKELLEKFI